MKSGGASPVYWAFSISTLIHISALFLANFDDNLDSNQKDEQVINITLEPIDQRNKSSQQALQPISKTRALKPLVHNETMPRDIVLPKIQEHSAVANILDQKPLPTNTKPISSTPLQPAQVPTHLENNLGLNEPNQLHESSHQKSPTPIPALKQELTQITPPPPESSKTLIPGPLNEKRKQVEAINPIEPIPMLDQELTQITPPPPKTVLPETLKKDAKQVEDIKLIQQPAITQTAPPEINKPLPKESTVVKQAVEATRQNDSTILKNSVAQEYAEILHNTLNKRIKRKYPRKAVQNCIEGTVRVRIKISPSGQQLSYKILNPNEAPSILKESTENVLNRQKGFAKFSEGLSDGAMTFEVNLIYRLPQCAN